MVDKEGVHIQVSYFLFSGGKFGAYMQVMIENDGPVTINIDSRKEWNIICIVDIVKYFHNKTYLYE